MVAHKYHYQESLEIQTRTEVPKQGQWHMEDIDGLYT